MATVHYFRLSIAAFAAFFLTAPLFADVTVSRVTRSDGFRGMGAFEAQSTEYYKGTSKREETKTKFKGAILGRLAGGDQITITRIADDKVLVLDPKRRTYQESTITQAAKQMEQAQKQMEGTEKGKEEKPTHRVTKADFKVTPTGEKKTINGFACDNYKASMLVEVENIETKQKSQNRMEANYWNTAEDNALKAMDTETMAFNQAYMKKLGISISPEEAGKFGLAAVAGGMGASEEQLKPKLAAMQKEIEKLKGAPIVTEVKWFMESEAMEAAQKQSRKEETSAKEEDEKLDMSGGASGILGGLAGKMAKKKMQSSAEKREAGQAVKPVFSSYNEIREVKVADVPSDTFQVPAGYKSVRAE